MTWNEDFFLRSLREKIILGVVFIIKVIRNSKNQDETFTYNFQWWAGTLKFITTQQKEEKRKQTQKNTNINHNLPPHSLSLPSSSILNTLQTHQTTHQLSPYKQFPNQTSPPVSPPRDVVLSIIWEHVSNFIRKEEDFVHPVMFPPNFLSTSLSVNHIITSTSITLAIN